MFSLRTSPDRLVAVLLMMMPLPLAGPAVADPPGTWRTRPEFQLSPEAPLSGLLTFETTQPCRAMVELHAAGRVESLPVPSGARERHEIAVLGLRPDTTHELHLTLRVEEQTLRPEPVVVTTRPLPADFPTFRVAVSAPTHMEPGLTLFNVFRWDRGVSSKTFGLFLAVDSAGEVRWYHPLPYPAAAIRPIEGGDLLYLYGARPTGLRRIDWLGRTVSDWHATGIDTTLSDGQVSVPVETMHHDVLVLPSGNLVVLTTEVRPYDDWPPESAGLRRTGTPGRVAQSRTAHVVGDVIVEFEPDGTVVHRWPLLDLLDPRRVGYDSLDSFWDLRAYQHVEGGTCDWSHANAIWHDPTDDALLVSLRHQDAIVKLDRQRGDVRWILGTPVGWRKPLDARVLKPTGRLRWPYHAHGVKQTPRGTLLLFDNGNLQAFPPRPPRSSERTFSRVVEFEVDEAAHTVRQVWEYDGGPGGRFYSPFLGDADWLPQTGNILITDGGHLEDERGRPVNAPPGAAQWARVLEVTRGQPAEVVFELLVDDRRHRPEFGWSIYRAERANDLGFAARSLQSRP